MVEVNPSCIVPSLCVKAAEMIKPESHLEVRHRDVGDKYAGKVLVGWLYCCFTSTVNI